MSNFLNITPGDLWLQIFMIPIEFFPELFPL